MKESISHPMGFGERISLFFDVLDICGCVIVISMVHCFFAVENQRKHGFQAARPI